MATASAKAELKEIDRKLRKLRKRLGRQRSSPGAAPAGTEEAADACQWAVAPSSQLVLAVFVFSGFQAGLAAKVVCERNGLLREDEERARELVELGYIKAPLSYLVEMEEPPRSKSHFRDLLQAARIIVEAGLYEWLVKQNLKGVCPGRSDMVDTAVKAIPSNLPQSVRAHLANLLGGGARAQRHWLRRFRRKYGVRLGKLPPRDDGTPEEMQQKALPLTLGPHSLPGFCKFWSGVRGGFRRPQIWLRLMESLVAPSLVVEPGGPFFGPLKRPCFSPPAY